MFQTSTRRVNRQLQYPLSQRDTNGHWEAHWERLEPFETEDCKAMNDWQLATYTTCNMVHEVDLTHLNALDTKTTILANGYWRDVWKIQALNIESRSDRYEFVLKTQRYLHDFVERNFDRNRRDALISEHFISSPYISDVFGFCGNSCLSEFGDGGDLTYAIWSYNNTKSEELVLGMLHRRADATGLNLNLPYQLT